MEKEPVKIKLGTILLIFAFAVIIVMAVVIGLKFKQKTEKNATNNNIANNNATNNTILESAALEDKETKQQTVNEQKDVDKIILDELKEKRFLAKNNIDIDSKVKYAKMNNNANPIYIVHVEHDSDEEGNCSIYFFVSYNNGQVLFDKALEHKYEYDLFYEENSKTIKAELTYKGFITTIYGKIKDDGEYAQLDEFMEPANDQNEQYIVNDNEVSATEFENRKKQYENKQYISFSEVAKKL